MEKLKIATKRIAAVAASATLVSSAVFGAGLGDYPNNFVSNGQFDGQVVVGAGAQAIDSTSAASVIADLKSEFSGSQEKVRITYRSSGSSDGEKIAFAESGNTWNYGEVNQNVRDTAFDESDDDNVFSDSETFSNGFSDEDYSQTLSFSNGAIVFEHALRDDQSDDISSHLFLEDTTIMTYTLELDSAMADVNANAETADFIGEDISILGQDYTITEIGFDGTLGVDKLGLIGGGSKVALGEGESQSVTVDGTSYEIEVQAVGDSEVLLTVNGQSQTIDEFDTQEVAGLNIGVTELIESSRDSVKGYAELVLGGQEILLDNGQGVKVDDQDIDDMFEDYQATVAFTGSGDDWTGFTVTYTLDDEMLLEEGDSFEDHVFGAIALMYEGTNNPEWSTIELTSNSDKLGLEGETIEGKSFSEDVALLTTPNSATSPIVLIGGTDDDIMLVSAVSGSEALNTTEGWNYNAKYGIAFTGTAYSYLGGASVSSTATGTNVTVGPWVILNTTGALTVAAMNVDEANGVRFLVGDADNQQLYEFKSFTSADDELDFEDVLSGEQKENVGRTEIASKLEDVSAASTASASAEEIESLTGMTSSLAFANDALVSLANVPSNTSTTSSLRVTLDSGDVNADDETTTTGDIDASYVNVTLSLDTTDDEFDINIATANFELPSGAEADMSSSNDDVLQYVTPYGMMVEIDNEDDKYVTISVPDEQVEAMVYLVTGSGVATTSEVTVDADDVEDKKAELEDDGYTIVKTESVTSEEVEFDVTAPVLDTAVSGNDDMIVIGGPAVNSVAASLLGMSYPTYGSASGVDVDEAVIRYFEDSNSVLVYGYSGEDTQAAVEKLNAGGLSGNSVNVE